MDIKQQFKSKGEVKGFVTSYTPILVRNKNGKLQSPFVSGAAYDLVVEGITEAIWKKVVLQTTDYKHLNNDQNS